MLSLSNIIEWPYLQVTTQFSSLADTSTAIDHHNQSLIKLVAVPVTLRLKSIKVLSPTTCYAKYPHVCTTFNPVTFVPCNQIPSRFFLDSSHLFANAYVKLRQYKPGRYKPELITVK